MESPLKLTVRSLTERKQISVQTTDTIETVYIVILRFHYGIRIKAVQ